MQDIVAALIGAGFVSIGILIGQKFNKRDFTVPDANRQSKLEISTALFPEVMYCGHVETVAAEEDDPWSYLLEPCENVAFVIMGGQTLCEDHRDTYLADMGKYK